VKLGEDAFSFWKAVWDEPERGEEIKAKRTSERGRRIGRQQGMFSHNQGKQERAHLQKKIKQLKNEQER